MYNNKLLSSIQFTQSKPINIDDLKFQLELSGDLNVKKSSFKRSIHTATISNINSIPYKSSI